VPGGGTTFVHLSESLKQWAKLNLKEDELVGAMIMVKAITSPLRRIVKNGGKNSAIVLERVQQESFNIGYNAAAEDFGDMYDLGIIDPAKVSRSALQNATSIAGMILTTECIVVDDAKK
jgi:chaperonin GroEL